MRKLVFALAAVALASACASAAELPTAEELLAKTKAAEAAMTSFEAQVRRLEASSANRFSSTVQVAVARSLKDGGTVEQSSEVGKKQARYPDGTQEEVAIKRINDGRYCWAETARADGKPVRVIQQDAKAVGRSAYGRVVGDFEDACREYDLKVVAEDDKAGAGEKAFVLEGPKRPPLLPGVVEARARFVVGAGDFILRQGMLEIRRAGDDAPGQDTVEVRNVKINQPVDAKLFVYTPPEGAKVVDQTKPKP